MWDLSGKQEKTESKMEKITNNRDEYIKAIKSELIEYITEDNYKEIFTYIEIPFFLQYAFSYNWAINTQTLEYRLKRREWNAEYDHKRFDKGIYNLDRLAITEKEIPINQEDKNQLKSTKWELINKVNFKGIILDGLMCELRANESKKSLIWNSD